MHVLKARFKDRQSFLEAFDEEIEGGGMFCPTTQQLETDDEVVVEVHFPELPNKMLVRGNVVSWRSALPRLRVRAGALVAFADEESDKVQFILDVAKGERTGAIKRRHARLPIEQKIRWRRENAVEFIDGALREISIGGGQLVTEEKLEIDDDVTLELTMPGGAAPTTIATKVTYHTPTGYGLRFLYRDGGGSRRLREMVRRLVEGE